MDTQEKNYWKKCSTCKKEIPFSAQYYICSVSTCQHKRKGFHFCSVECWDAHLGFMNHREAWAKEVYAPAKGAQLAQSPAASSARSPVRKVVDSKTSSSSSNTQQEAQTIQTDILVVVSKVKKLIKDQSSFNTSQCCIEALTQKVILECLKGIENAKKADRKTVMGRDIN